MKFTFTLYNLLKRNDADKACATLLREVDVTSVRVPTEQELRDSVEKKTAFLLMQKTAMIRDTPASFKLLQQETVGAKRDFIYMDPLTRPHQAPTYPAWFKTIAPPYNCVPYLHRLFTTDINDLKDPGKRKRQSLESVATN